MYAKIHNPKVRKAFKPEADMQPEPVNSEVTTYHSEELRQYAIEKYGPPIKPLNHYRSQWYRQDPEKSKEPWK